MPQNGHIKLLAEDLEATKLSLINSVVTTYYQIVYLNDAISTNRGNHQILQRH